MPRNQVVRRRNNAVARSMYNPRTIATVARTGWRVGRGIYNLYKKYKSSGYKRRSTQTKFKQWNRPLAENMSSNYATFFHKYGPRRKPRIARNLAPIQYYENSVANIEANGGFQVNKSFPMYDNSDLVNLDNQLPNGDNQMMRCLGGTMKMYMSNQVEAPVKVTVRYLINRKDTSLVPESAWAAGMLSQTTSATASTFVGAVPYACQEFVQYWKVKKTKTFDVPPGGNLIVTIKSKNFATLREAYWRNGLNTSFSGLTSFVMVTAHGFPVTEALIPANVSTAPVKLSVIKTKTFYITYTERLSQAGKVNNVLASLTTPRTIAQEESTIEDVDIA